MVYVKIARMWGSSLETFSWDDWTIHLVTIMLVKIDEVLSSSSNFSDRLLLQFVTIKCDTKLHLNKRWDILKVALFFTYLVFCRQWIEQSLYKVVFLFFNFHNFVEYERQSLSSYILSSQFR